MNARLGRSLSKTRRAVAALSCAGTLSTAFGQPPSIEPLQADAPALWRPYSAGEVPPARLGNSSRIHDLIRAGNLYLTIQDAIALVLENDIDIEVSRYNPIAAVWQLQRAEAGAALPTTIRPATLVGSVAPGQGVIGSETSASVTPTQNTSSTVSKGGAGGGSTSSGSGGSSASSGTASQSYDPIFSESTVAGHMGLPQFDSVLSQTPVLVSTFHTSVATLQEGFLSGGSVTTTFSDHYLKENAATDVLNPSVAPDVSIALQHNLLRGFGVGVNSRFIDIARIDIRVSDLLLRLQLINAVAQTLQLYYGLVAGYDDVKAKQTSLEVAQELYQENKRQAEVGSLTALDVTTAEAEVAASERDLLLSQTGVSQIELQLKNLLSRSGTADPLLRQAHIVTLDRIVIPSSDELPPLETLVQQALANRPDLAIEKAEIESAQLEALGSRNAILPVLQVFGSEADAGLAGTRQTITNGKVSETPTAFFAGGTLTALGQVFRRDFPNDRAGSSLQATVFNRQAQADYGVDQLSLRQLELTNQKSINEVQVDLMGAVVKLQQARSRYDSAVHFRMLEEQLLDSERKAHSVGASTSYDVMQAQRGLAIAQDAELTAMLSWSSAMIALDELRGITLEANHVSIDEAKTGAVARPSAPPN
jgi:outer membrane protein